MIEAVCPICLGEDFGDFRGRNNARCSSCYSLERHRSFKLFSIWLGPEYTRLILSTLRPLEKISRLEKGVEVEDLDDVDLPENTGGSQSSTVIFLENIVGYREITESEKYKIRAFVDAGALVSFTCRAGGHDKYSELLFDLFGHKAEIKRFSPLSEFGGVASSQFGLSDSNEADGSGSIHFYSKQCDVVAA